MTGRKKEDPQPAGFGRCGVCPYLEYNAPAVCYRCARQTFEKLPSTLCPVCALPLEREEKCGNPVCDWNNRYFDQCHAVSMRSGILKGAIDRYKYENRCAWSLIFGRVLAGYLNANSELFQEIDLIICSPTFTSPGGRREWDHIRTILQKAAEQFDHNEWPFDLGDPPTIVQTAETPQFMGKTWRQRYEIATGPLRSALSVPDQDVVRGKHILVFDDVFTDGLRMNEVARALKYQGRAKTISGLVLARQPFRGAKSSVG